MHIDTLQAHHRVILCHYDSYSTALVFALWPDKSLLWPSALPDGAVPVDAAPAQDGEAVRQAVVDALALNGDDVVLMPEFDECFRAGDAMLRVHLLRFTTFEAPGKTIEPAGGVFKPLSGLRGSAQLELGLLREVFNLMVGGAGRQRA